jgi:hypothetical protein
MFVNDYHENRQQASLIAGLLLMFFVIPAEAGIQED